MKSTIPFLIFAGLVTIYSCKGNKEQTDKSTATQSTTETKSASTSANESKTYVVTALPDSVLLGKNKEAVIKIKNLKATELSNPNGQVTGIELTYDIEVTNKNSIGGSSTYINPSDFRLELDNGTKLTHDFYNTVSVEPEATASSTGNKFIIPPGAKPTALNLFYSETRSTVKLEFK